MLSEGSEISHKRVITFSAFILLAIAFLLNLFWNIKVSEALLNIMETLVMFGFGSTVVEKFAKKNSNNSNPNEDKPTQDQPILPEEEKK